VYYYFKLSEKLNHEKIEGVREMKCRSLVLIFLIILSLSLASCTSGTGPSSHENEMTAFNIVNVSPPATGVIDQSGHGIAITVPNDTDVTHLIATFTVSAGATVYVNNNYSTVQQSGITTNDFTNPVVYTVWSAGNYLQDYTVTVTVAAPVGQPPPTGQMTSYGTRDDGNLQKGIAWPNPRFIDNSNGTIMDNLTGLVWLKDANCFGTRTWSNSLNDANALNNGECGLTDGSVEGDWRLPNVNELKSLVNIGQANTATWLAAQGFTNVQANWYWSSSTFAFDINDRVWLVGMEDGYVGPYYKTSNYCVWPVRAGQ
jgi:hypothetical protein